MVIVVWLFVAHPTWLGDVLIISYCLQTKFWELKVVFSQQVTKPYGYCIIRADGNREVHLRRNAEC